MVDNTKLDFFFLFINLIHKNNQNLKIKIYYK